MCNVFTVQAFLQVLLGHSEKIHFIANIASVSLNLEITEPTIISLIFFCRKIHLVDKFILLAAGKNVNICYQWEFPVQNTLFACF